MAGPSDAFRRQIAISVLAAEDEDELGTVLDAIHAATAENLGRAQEPQDLDQQQADALLAEIEAWAGLASYAVLQFHSSFEPPEGPGGLFKSGKDKLVYIWPGWRPDIVQRLRQIGRTLQRPLANVCDALGAAAYTVGTGFPLGVSISITWTGSQIVEGIEKSVQAAKGRP
jgi:hypothetical protein